MSFAARRLGLDGGASFSMVAGTGTFTSKVTFTYKGFSNTTGSGGASAGAFGTMTPAAFNGATINELAWGPVASGGTTGQVTLQLAGALAAGFVTSVTANGVSLGTVTQTSSGSQSTWTVGLNNAANPFTSGVTYSIGIN